MSRVMMRSIRWWGRLTGGTKRVMLGVMAEEERGGMVFWYLCDASQPGAFLCEVLFDDKAAFARAAHDAAFIFCMTCTPLTKDWG